MEKITISGKKVNNMKRVKNFNMFINESIRSLMKPKSEEEVRKSLGYMDAGGKVLSGIDFDLIWLVNEGINEGANINERIQVRNERTFGECSSYIEFACYKGNVDIIKLLLDNGATKKNYNKEICLIHAEFYNTKQTYKQIFELLHSYDKTNESIRDLMKPKSEEEIRKNLGEMTPNEKNSIKKFIGIDESIRDLMTPKSKEDIKNVVDKMSKDKKWRYIKKYEISKLYTDDELRDIRNDFIEDEYDFFIPVRSNESIRSLMKPISPEELDKVSDDAIDRIFYEVSWYLVNKYKKFKDMSDAESFVYNNIEELTDLAMEGKNSEYIANYIKDTPTRKINIIE
jgi:hypothetical protein